MRRPLITALAMLTGMIGSVVLAAPARANVVHAYYGNRGHGWTNTASTRVGVEDQRRDGIQIFVYGAQVCVDPNWCEVGHHEDYIAFDANNNDPGHSVYYAWTGYRVLDLMVCGQPNGRPVYISPETCGSQQGADW
jgi:hypothetical protein